MNTVWTSMEQSFGAIPEVQAYTDGACLGNPGPGGYGVVLIGEHGRTELSGGARRTTNNRMELLAVIAALQALKRRCSIVIHTDSQYVAQGINEGWALRWRARGWRLQSKKTAKNHDLWATLLALLEGHEARIVWIKGHNGTPENERADQLAGAAAVQPDLPPDAFFEEATAPALDLFCA